MSKVKTKKRKVSKAKSSRGPMYEMRRLERLDKALEQREMERINEILNKPFVMSMDFELAEVADRLQAFHDKYDLPEMDIKNGIFVPEKYVIDAYDQQDMIIALKMQQVRCEKWEIGIDTHFYNYETDEVKSVPFQVSIEGVNYGGIYSPDTKACVMRESGFKTRWKGLTNELEQAYKEAGITNDFKKIKTLSRFTGEMYFESYQMYLEHLFMIDLRDKGTLIEFLDNYTKQLIIDGKLTNQCQPTNPDETGIPVSAFNGLVKEVSKLPFSFEDVA